MIQLDLFMLYKVVYGVCPDCGGPTIVGLIGDVFCVADNQCVYREVTITPMVAVHV